MIHVVRIVGATILFGYGALMFTDYHPAIHPRTQIPLSVRSSPGGLRSWSFSHSGQHGGK